jgi:hypothetical protein
MRKFVTTGKKLFLIFDLIIFCLAFTFVVISFPIFGFNYGWIFTLAYLVSMILSVYNLFFGIIWLANGKKQNSNLFLERIFLFRKIQLIILPFLWILLFSSTKLNLNFEIISYIIFSFLITYPILSYFELKNL